MLLNPHVPRLGQTLYVYGNDPNHPNGTWNIEVGYGLVNAGAAVALAQQMGGYTYIRDSIVTGTVVWTGNKMIHDSLVIDHHCCQLFEAGIFCDFLGQDE